MNCIRNYPWYKGWHEKYGKKGLTMIGVHTPESAGEANPASVRKKAKENKLEFAIALDNDAKTWRAWGNRYWPSIYLIDKKGFVRYRWDGELNGSETKGEAIMRQKIEDLLAERE